jgi:hypothetical protein
VPGLRADRVAITGDPPSPYADFPHCRFASRCPHVIDPCREIDPPLVEIGPRRLTACLRSAELEPFTALADSEALMSDVYRRRLGLLRQARLPILYSV